MKTIFITGGCGFIGSNFLLHWAQNYPDWRLVNLDIMSYAANIDNVAELEHHPNYIFLKDDINHVTMNKKVLCYFEPDYIVHFAAESHVDRSIESSGPFVKHNVMGTVNFLDSVRFYMRKVSKEFRFLHVSTDEVFGSLREHDEPFNELSQYAPNSPYSASKAASDHFVRSYYQTHNVPAMISNCSNNYGPRQNKEKFIPTVIRHALADKPIPVYGNGMNIRDWLWVDDHCTALETLLLHGNLGEQYCIGGDNEVNNIDLATRILEIMGKSKSLISYVTDRAGHDFRYAIDSSKLQSLGWQANMSFTQGLERTVDWYLQRPERFQ